MTRRAAIAALVLAALFAAVGARDAHAEWVTEVVTNYNVPASYFYERGGIIAQWDGIDNVGWGTHSSTATSWVDLEGGIFGDLTISGAGVDYVQFSNSSQSKSISYTMPKTIELGIKLVTSDNKPFLNFGGIVNWSGLGSNGFLIPYLYSSRTTAESFCKQIFVSGNYNNAQTITLTSSTMTLYQNGSLSSSKSISPNFNYSVFQIGGYGGTFSGQVKWVRFYSRALSAAEIAHNYELDNYRFMGGATPSFPLYIVTTNRVYRAPAPMRSYDAAHPFNNAAARTRLGGTGSGEDGTTLRPSAHFDIKKNEED